MIIITIMITISITIMISIKQSLKSIGLTDSKMLKSLKSQSDIQNMQLLMCSQLNGVLSGDETVSFLHWNILLNARSHQKI